MMKKMIALLTAVVMAASLSACAAAGAPAASSGGSEASTEASSVDMKVAMITDYGDITDQSFNQSTYEACKAFGEANGVDFTYYKPEGDSDAERVAMID